MTAKFKGYRTIAFNLIMLTLGVIASIYPEAILPSAAEVDAVLANLEALILTVTAVGNLVLRAFTTTPVFQKGPQS